MKLLTQPTSGELPDACSPARPSEELLLALFREAKNGELSALLQLGVPVAPLIDMQYRARASEYAARYPLAEDRLLRSWDGQKAGRLLLHRSQPAWRVVDLAVLERFRGQGIAATAIRQVQKEASLAGAEVSLRVLRGSLAVPLYQRLGFQVCESGHPVFLEMLYPAHSGLYPLARPATKELAHAV